MNRSWTFLTNHAHVLVCLARDPDLTLRGVADQVGITERAAHRIVSGLVEENVLEKERVGRRNRYTVNSSSPLRHPLEEHATVGQLLLLLNQSADESVAPDTSSLVDSA